MLGFSLGAASLQLQLAHLISSICSLSGAKAQRIPSFGFRLEREISTMVYLDETALVLHTIW